MTAMRQQALDGFLRRPDPEIRSILVYGADPAGVADVARQVLRRKLGNTADDLNLVELDDKALAADPGRLADEVQSMSLLGGARVVWVRGADSNLAKQIAPLLEAQTAANFVLAESDSLSKSSALRQLYEENARVLCVPVYEPTDSDALTLISTAMREHRLAMPQDAQARLVELAGKSLPLLRQEIEKLVLYCYGRESITLDDVERLCASGGEAETDELVSHVFGGDVEEADLDFGIAMRAGIDPGRIASLCHQHTLRLIDLRHAMEKGMTADQALKSVRPPIFFSLQKTMAGQLRIWPLEGLLAVASSLAAGVRDSRTAPGLAESVVNRALLAVARRARSARTDRF